MRVWAATIRVPAAAARSSRSVTGRQCEFWIADRGLRIEGGLRANPQSEIRNLQFSGAGDLPSAPTFPPMPLRLAEHPEHDRPRERLWAVGPAALTGHELLAILLGTGCAGRDALVVAGELPAVGGGAPPPLRSRPPAAVSRVPRGGPGTAARRAAA